MWSVASLGVIVSVASTGIPHAARSAAPPQLDRLMFFGFMAAFVTLTCAVIPYRSRVNLLVFSICLGTCATYGFLQGAWPLGIVEGVWSIASLRRWYVEGQLRKQAMRSDSRSGMLPRELENESRITRMFGPK